MAYKDLTRSSLPLHPLEADTVVVFMLYLVLAVMAAPAAVLAVEAMEQADQAQPVKVMTAVTRQTAPLALKTVAAVVVVPEQQVRTVPQTMVETEETVLPLLLLDHLLHALVAVAVAVTPLRQALTALEDLVAEETVVIPPLTEQQILVAAAVEQTQTMLTGAMAALALSSSAIPVTILLQFLLV